MKTLGTVIHPVLLKRRCLPYREEARGCHAHAPDMRMNVHWSTRCTVRSTWQDLLYFHLLCRLIPSRPHEIAVITFG